MLVVSLAVLPVLLPGEITYLGLGFLTFIFVTSRVLNPLPAIQHMSDQAYVIFLFITLIVALVVPDLYFSWRELTTRRVR